jgi:hypothetical protein
MQTYLSDKMHLKKFLKKEKNYGLKPLRKIKNGFFEITFLEALW